MSFTENIDGDVEIAQVATDVVICMEAEPEPIKCGRVTGTVTGL